MVGGAATFFSLAASFFTDVRLVAVVGEDFADEHVQVFVGRRIDLEGLQRVPGETFRWKGEYSLDLSTRSTIYTRLNVFQDFRPTIPDHFQPSPFVFLANIHPGPAARRARSGTVTSLYRARHDELLDRADSGRAFGCARPCERGRH